MVLFKITNNATNTTRLQDPELSVGTSGSVIIELRKGIYSWDFSANYEH